MPWPDSARATVPYWVYTDESVLQRERERVFAGGWNYVGLQAELAGPGSFSGRSAVTCP
jgi:phenylpropionate dioxygenase-like ring-hydroxylating dioxygenase large terminal subunit